MPTSDQVQKLLDELETSLSELECAESAKLSAITRLDGPSLLAAVEHQSRITSHIAETKQSFPSITQHSDGGSAVSRWLAEVDPAKRPLVEARVQRIRERVTRIKLGMAADWLMTWKLNRFVSDLLATLAQANGHDGPQHGLVLDSTA